ncbi:eukaryotic translation initiation factor subunit eIF [Cordyceps militaris]|uniref:Eukaryotic translation initiation factor subunit eIF n=1 Tax=Cordyceps militaris TaxID=73501 RepID=A0A2H4SVY4_CORMI|nr:eukaryotic translation initiation factor subunit eIF [Cordyceps militaris]
MAAPNPVVNGGPPAPAGNKSNIQFGFDSPSVAHSTPQSSNVAPMAIPAANNAGRVPSPAHSPSPIPQPSASGGRPPTMQAGGQMTFGSLGSDGERHMRQGSVPPNSNAIPTQPGAHFRRESTNSLHGDNNRGNYQGGRGRGYNNHHNNYNNQMGYPPNNQFRNGQGRGMPPAFQPQGRGMPYPNSPHQPNRSPAPVSSMPNTPNMPPANMHGHMQTPPQYHYPPPMAPQQQQVQYPFPRVFSKSHKKYPHRREQDKVLSDLRRQAGSTVKYHACYINPPQLSDITEQSDQMQPRMHNLPSKPRGGLNNSEILPKSNHSAPINNPNSNSFDLSPENGGFERLLTMRHQNYGYPPQQVDQYGRPINMTYGYNNVPPYMGGPPQGTAAYGQQYPPTFHQQSTSMSRTPSQPERPTSASQSSQPVVVSSGQAQGANVPKGASNFVMPRKSAAIQIKNLAGEVVDTSSFKAPVSPAPLPVRTPPVVASTPTPPPVKPSTPSHGRTDSQATPKTAKEIQDELKEKIKRATQQSAATEEPAAPKAETPATKPSEAPKTEAAVKEEPKAAEVAKNDDPDEDEVERMIREMEEADARREKEEGEHRKRREAEKAEAKKNEEVNRKANAEDADRKLREQEREMERLEEERERKRNEGEGSGKSLSVGEALAKARSGGAEGAEGNVDSVTDKLADMKIEGDKTAESRQSEKRAAKPAALNLAPLNTKPVEPPQPTPAMQSLKSARFLQVMEQDVYPAGIHSPNPALNAAVAKKGKTFRYDAGFLLQFQKVFTEQPSIEFHQQVKSLIGDGDGNRASIRTPAIGNPRQGSRGGAGFPGGPFNAPPGRGGMSGGMSGGALPGKPGGINPLGSFQRPGASFPGSAGMVRSGSQRGPGPNSPRQSSRQTRGSRRNDVQASKTMPLTANQDVKPISISSTGWKPTSIGKSAVANSAANAGYLDPENVQKKVKAALNKMTPEKFDRISDQILVIASQSKDESDGRTLRQVIQLTFEKATDESHWASMYAKFCKRMLETMSPDVRDERIKDKNGNIVSGGNLFRKYLLNRCQEDFERGWSTNVADPPKEEEKKDAAEGKKNGEVKLMSDEYYLGAAAKRRGLGLVQFIGELYKLGMLTERIMHECVHKLVDYKRIPDEAEVESLCKLLRTIGANLDETEKGRPMMDAYFERIQTMVDLPELPSRIKFLLMDIIDLRRAGWRGKTSGLAPPKTLEEIRIEAEAAQAAKAQETARSNQRGGGRPPVGRGDARNFSAGYTQQTSNQVGMDDLKRLKGSVNRTSSQNITLGPTSMFSSRSNSGRRMGPGGSFGRGEDSAMSSRAGTPPTRENSNTFSLLATMDSENPASPPSAAASPALSKAVPDSDKKESE